MLHFMSENKRILNMGEKRFSELENFQANTIVFQTNTNAILGTPASATTLLLRGQARL